MNRLLHMCMHGCVISVRCHIPSCTSSTMCCVITVCMRLLPLVCSHSIIFRVKSILPDILSKHWSYEKLWNGMLQPLLFHSGNTANLINDEE